MLQLNPRQAQAFDQWARQREARRLAPIMRRHFAQQTQKLDNTALQASITQALDRAAAWGVKRHSACVNFVILWLLLGPDFDKQGAIKQYLSLPAPGLDASVRINSLMSEFKYLLDRRNPSQEH